ncbi:MAG: uL15m family ribosomal protein [Candidatus Altiarchaeia archaeon]
MAQKDRKIQSKRGTRSCGWGNTQKHRGAGSRGGRGMAGSNKQKWSYVSKYMPDHFGRSGFKRPLKMLHDDKTINVSDINRMVNDGDIASTDKKYIIDLAAMGYDKLLGSGKVTYALEIKVAKSSKSAIEKVENAGGKVVVLEEQTVAPVSK